MTALRRIGHAIGQAWLTLTSRSSGTYWERRYRIGLNSGSGSYGPLAEFKAEVINQFVIDQAIQSVIELGCGDGHQLSLANYPSYIGLDVAASAIDLCSRRFAGDPAKTFLRYDEARSADLAKSLSAELVLSLDVVYHLVEDEVYLRHLDLLFGIARRWVIVYSSNCEDASPLPHVRHRRFADDIHQLFPGFELVRKIENRHRELSFADFYLFRRVESESRRA